MRHARPPLRVSQIGSNRVKRRTLSLQCLTAATDARVWKITRETFRAIMQISGSREREENLQFLRSAPFLQELEESLLNKVVDLLQRVSALV